MKIVGLIAEYNPFHNGHAYHIQKAKELTGADAVVVVMSGDFVQRGEPAVISKYHRTQMALSAGVDAVFELPVVYACGSAEYFARGAVSLLDSLGCIDSVCFGSECGDLAILSELSEIISSEPEDYRAIFKRYLSAGYAYPAARALALRDYLPNQTLTDLLKSPNNILGIEYIRAINSIGSRITPCTITREGSGYHSFELSDSFSSASAIRTHLYSCHTEDGLAPLKGHIPDAGMQILDSVFQSQGAVRADDFSLLLKYRLLSETDLLVYQDLTEELVNRIRTRQNEFRSISAFCEQLKTKNFTYTRISRALFHILLDIRKFEIDKSPCPYARLLGFSREHAQVLSEIKKSSSIPVLTRLTKAAFSDSYGKRLLEKDIFAANLYESVLADKYHTPFIHEYQQQIKKM